MDRMVVEQRLSDQGVLQLTLPLGVDEAGRDVRITIEPVRPTKEITPEEWRKVSWRPRGAGRENLRDLRRAISKRENHFREPPARHERVRRPHASRAAVEGNREASCRG